MTRSLLVTGLSGFIGRHCIPYLLNTDYVVHAVGRSPKPAFIPEVIHWHQLDLFQHASVAALLQQIKPTHCLNLAWNVVHGQYWRSPDNLLWVQAALNLLYEFANAGGQRFVGAGSCAEYQWADAPLVEDESLLRPQTPFGRFKHALYEASAAFAQVKDLSFAWGRVFFVYGPHEPQAKLISSNIIRLLQGKKVACSHPQQQRDFIYVDDVARIFCALLDNDAQGAINIGSGQAEALRTVMIAIAEQLGMPNYVKLPLGQQRTSNDCVIAETSRLQQLALEVEYNLAQGIQKMIAFYKVNQFERFGHD